MDYNNSILKAILDPAHDETATGGNIPYMDRLSKGPNTRTQNQALMDFLFNATETFLTPSPGRIGMARVRPPGGGAGGRLPPIHSNIPQEEVNFSPRVLMGEIDGTARPGINVERTGGPSQNYPNDPYRYTIDLRDDDGRVLGGLSFATDHNNRIITRNPYGEHEGVTLHVEPHARNTSAVFRLLAAAREHGVSIDENTLRNIDYTPMGAALTNSISRHLTRSTNRPISEVGDLVRSHFHQDNVNPATGVNQSAPRPNDLRNITSMATMRRPMPFDPNIRERSFNPTEEAMRSQYDAVANRRVLTPANRTNEQEAMLDFMRRGNIRPVDD